MAGIHPDHSVHRIVSGETPEVGMHVLTNNLDKAVIVKVATDEGCGWYCNAWHEVELYETYKGEPIQPGRKQIMNCERLSTKRPT